jgi:hypothetical protein
MDCPSWRCSRKCRFYRASQRWREYGGGFQGRRRREVKEALDSNGQACERARGPSKWERLLHAPRAEWSLRQSALEQMGAMRAGAARTRWTVELAFKGFPRRTTRRAAPLLFPSRTRRAPMMRQKFRRSCRQCSGQRNACLESVARRPLGDAVQL